MSRDILGHSNRTKDLHVMDGWNYVLYQRQMATTNEVYILGPIQYALKYKLH